MRSALVTILLAMFSFASEAIGSEAIDTKIQTTLERALPRLSCNLSATSESKYPVMVIKDGKLQIVKMSPAKGSILGAASKENPDYYFVWMRDSSLTADALVQFLASRPGTENSERLWTFMLDYLSFSAMVQKNGSHYGVNDPRCNIDGSVDLLQWSRPQRDGPALQSLALLRFFEKFGAKLNDEEKRLLKSVVARNLDDISLHASGKSYDPWEFVFGDHLYVRLVQLGALEEGVRLFGPEAGSSWRGGIETLKGLLENHRDDDGRLLRSSVGIVTDWRGNVIPVPGDGLDTSTMLAVLHARRKESAYSVRDPAVIGTALTLEGIFRELYPINKDGSEGPAMGRFKGDDYFGGNPWFVTTLAQAEFYFRRAQSLTGSERIAALRKGEAFLARVLEVIPADGMVGEQFDMVTGIPKSSHDLSWSYASLLTAALAREQLLDSGRPTRLDLGRVDFRCTRSSTRR